jgi:hypothetical protein
VLLSTAKDDPRNEEDYDTWEYGTEPIPGDQTWRDSEDGCADQKVSR